MAWTNHPRNGRFIRREQQAKRLAATLLTILFFSAAAGPSLAQEGEIAPPEDVTLVTSDRVQLHCTWLAGNREKETVPAIMLHGWNAEEADRAEQLSMAQFLQQAGHAVLVPDLRGHGKSMTLENSTEEFKTDRWGPAEISAAIEDIEACKKFLIGKNNAGELNIDLLCVIAEEETTLHAISWALRDWSYQPIGGRKQGQDVKALVLINPVRSFRGINGNDWFRSPLFTGAVGAGFPILVAATGSHRRDARNIHGAWERDRRGLEKDKQNLDYVSFRVERQDRIVRGNDGEKPLSMVVAEFLQTEVTAHSTDFRWQDRSSQ